MTKPSSPTENHLVHIAINPERKKKDPKYAGWTLPTPTPEDVAAAEQRGAAHAKAYYAQRDEFLSRVSILPRTDTRTNRERKKCAQCGRTRELKYFARSPYGFGNRLATCKSCIAAKKRKTRNKKK